MNLVLDFGNTKIKAAVFSDSNEVIELFTWDNYSNNNINEIKSKYLIDNVLLCSVVEVSEEIGISQAQVSRLEKCALKKIKN